MDCKFRNDNSLPICSLGMYNGMPSFGICKQCVKRGQNTPEHAEKIKNKINGLGDVIHSVANPIAKAIDATLGTNIENCGSCKKRRNKLNEMFPIKVE